MLNNVRVIAVIIVHGTPKRISPYPLPLMFLSNMLSGDFLPSNAPGRGSEINECCRYKV